MSKVFYYLFLIIAVLEVFADAVPNPALHTITKPLLMPLLIAFYVSAAKYGRQQLSVTDKIMVAAFVFSWGGDVALMFGNLHQLYFLLGLVSFLITHVLYIIAFGKAALPKPGFLKRKPLYALPFIAYFVFLVTFLLNYIPAHMQLPILIYTTVIGLMVLAALNNAGRVPAKSFLFVFSGAVLFMFSDSIIAINKFTMQDQLPFAGVFIMTLYIAGQLLIARGMLIKNQPADSQ